MKHIKMLGLAALAALAVMAVAGVGTASASQVVKDSAGVAYPNGTKFSATLAAGTVATLTASPEVTCKKSTVAGVLTDNTKGHGEINTFTFGECHTNSGTICNVKAVNLNYTATAETNGLVITAKGTNGPPGALVECGSFINCTFTTNSITLDVVSGAPAHITASNEALNSSGFLCPSEAKWDATYVSTAPAKGIFVA